MVDGSAPGTYFEAITAPEGGPLLVGGYEGVASADPVTLELVHVTAACDAAQISVQSEPVSPMTGEYGLIFRLANAGPEACGLYGVPSVRLLDDAGRPMRSFLYNDKPSPYFSDEPPLPILLAPGEPAYLMVAKYRCDIGVEGVSATARLRLPGVSRGAVTVPAEFDMCSGGHGDPGNSVGVSRIVASEQDLYPS